MVEFIGLAVDKMGCQLGTRTVGGNEEPEEADRRCDVASLDGVLESHQPLLRAPRGLRGAEDLDAVVMRGDDLLVRVDELLVELLSRPQPCADDGYLVGWTALSVETSTNSFVPWVVAASATLRVPITLFRAASMTFCSARGTCL